MWPLSVVDDGATGKVIAVDGFMVRFLLKFDVSPGSGRLPPHPAHTSPTAVRPLGLLAGWTKALWI
jgi:hypothetical protein